MSSNMVRVEWEGRGKVFYSDEEEAREAILAEYPDAEIGHDGDLSEGGDRTLAWANEADSINDDGKNAIASIHRLAEDV